MRSSIYYYNYFYYKFEFKNKRDRGKINKRVREKNHVTMSPRMVTVYRGHTINADLTYD